MLEIDSGSNTIYLTKGDTGIINITINGQLSNYSNLKLYVRNINKLDESVIQKTVSLGSTSGITTKTVSITINSNDTNELKRQKYVYDLKLEGTGNITTFVGGGKTKTEFWIT